MTRIYSDRVTLHLVKMHAQQVFDEAGRAREVMNHLQKHCELQFRDPKKLEQYAMPLSLQEKTRKRRLPPSCKNALAQPLTYHPPRMGSGSRSMVNEVVSS